MSRVRDVLRRRGPLDQGFSLVEVIVALVILGLAAAALIPIFVIGARAAVGTRLETQGKNVAQQRIEAMRQLPYHVDRQNGPYVDLLDYYYPNRVAASGTGAGWVSSTSAARLPGEPATGAFYRVVFDPVAGAPGFRQTVATQFLTFARTPTPDATFAAYTTQTAGADSPPSPFVGVSVVTSWTDGGSARSFEAFTQISDPGQNDSRVAAVARATALRVESSAPDLTVLSAEAGTISADGKSSDGSTASVEATAGRATRSGMAATSAASGVAVAPSGSQPGDIDRSAVESSSGCGYAAFGRSEVRRATSSISSANPLVPADVGTADGTPSNRSWSALLANPGGTCGAFWFSNLSTSPDPTLRLLAGEPLVDIDGGSSGSSPVTVAEGWLTATEETASPRFVRAGASAATDEAVQLFHTSFTGAQPLVTMKLISSAIECDSRNTVATASYRVVVDYRRWDGAREVLVDQAWSAASGPSTDPLAAIDLTTKIVYQDGSTTLTLADYVASWSLGTALSEGSTNGISSLDAALRVTTVPVRGTVDPTSSLGLRLGSLSCVADDNR